MEGIKNIEKNEMEKYLETVSFKTREELYYSPKLELKEAERFADTICITEGLDKSECDRLKGMAKHITAAKE
ncbi:MAG: hypothetical protein ACP5RF_03830 [Candidatus Micrarchaeia archaeon]